MDKEFYGLAAEEVARGEVDSALLVKAVSLSDGDEKRGRALYIQLRAGEISREHRRKLKTLRARDRSTDSDSDLERGAKALGDMVWMILLAVTIIALLVAIAY